jgi:phage recombination protein Bet
MTQAVAQPAPAPPNNGSGIIATMAHRYGLEPNKFLNTIKATVFPQGKEVSLEQTAAFLVVANQYNLNPFIKEIYAFPGRGGGVVPIVSVDGWATLINRQENLDGIEFHDHLDEGTLTAVTCRIYRKDRSHPTEVTEYMNECRRDTDTWHKWPSRMLRHKALIQAARYAFGLVGIYDPDEAERIVEAGSDATGGGEPAITMPQRKSETAPEPQNAIDAEVVNETKPIDEAAEKKRLRASIRDLYTKEQIEKITGGKKLDAMSVDELVELQEKLKSE